MIHFQSISILSIVKLYTLQRPDLIVLSGSGEVPLNFSLDLYRDELELIKTTKFPILGICFGFEAIVTAYGEKLIKNDKKITGIHEINLVNSGEKINVWQNHSWRLEKTTNLEVLADSSNGIEIIKIPNKKIYGVQFHPEHEHVDNNGDLILDEIINKIMQKN